VGLPSSRISRRETLAAALLRGVSPSPTLETTRDPSVKKGAVHTGEESNESQERQKNRKRKFISFARVWIKLRD
jgi:hypothetical protein